MPGPPGKRDAERRRRNKDGVETLKVDLDAALGGEIEIPAPPTIDYEKNPETGEITELDEPVHAWHETAVSWYTSLTKSGQALFYEPSDWALAYLMAEQISLNLEPRPVQIGTDAEGQPTFKYMRVPMPGTTLKAILSASSELMATEGARRKLRIELDRKKHQESKLSGAANVVSIAKNRQDVFKRAERG